MELKGQHPKGRQAKEQHLVVAPETEIALIKARQKLAITIGAIAFLLVVAVGATAFLLMQKYQQGLAQLPKFEEKRQVSIAQGVEQKQAQIPNIAHAQKGKPIQHSSNLLQAPPLPPIPLPVQQTQQSLPSQSLLAQPNLQQLSTPPQPTLQNQQPSIPAGLPDYLEQLRRIEMQRKSEASNFWIALQALSDLVKALQGVSATGDILDAPNYDLQQTLKAYDAYLQRFMVLRQWLHRLNPPQECWRLHQSYDQALSAHINAISSLKQRIVSKDLFGAALSGLTIQGQIDAALGAADNELAAVCQRYGISKPFKIGDER
ncbi:MAG: hypothetical protein NZ805_06990 [Armatimonadetes bacterium]|nr:hypothetical protein [Armatimonadota bacterium]MDW8027508.1 hypothetical protein [Armatimonadota bacterium]